MTKEETIAFEEVLNTPVEKFATLPLMIHTSRAKEVYIKIRPALTSIGWIIGFLKPKFKKGIDVLIVLLDNLFNALPD